MSLMQSVVETVAHFLPDPKRDPLIDHDDGFLGKPFDRVDAEAKVKGEARFTAEFEIAEPCARRACLQHHRQGQDLSHRHRPRQARNRRAGGSHLQEHAPG